MQFGHLGIALALASLDPRPETFRVVGALAVAQFGPWLGGLALASIVAHVLADLPTDTGLPLLLPLSRRRFSLNLWKNTGYWGRAMYVGYYRQPWAWILES